MGHPVSNNLKTLSFLLNQSLHFHIPFRICMCISKEAPEYPHLPQEPAKFPKGPRQQARCTQGLACYSSAQCGYGVCQTIPGSGKYVLIPKVWFFFWFQHRKQFITPYSYHHFLNKTKGTLVHECEQLTLLSTCSDYRLQGTSNLLIEAKS